MRISLTTKEFADIIICFLNDIIIYSDEIKLDNEMFNEIINDMKSKGFKSKFLNYYLKLSSDTRLEYKKINKIFRNGKNSREIQIIPKEKNKKDKENKKKNNLISKLVKVVKKRKEN